MNKVESLRRVSTIAVCVALGLVVCLAVGPWASAREKPAAARPAPVAAAPASQPTVFHSVRTAIAEGRLEKSAGTGLAGQMQSFDEGTNEGRVLVGFDVGLGPLRGVEVVYALCALYLTDHGLIQSRAYGAFTDQLLPGGQVSETKVKRTIRLQAPAGYAVGSVTIRVGQVIHGLGLTYLKITDKGTLDLSTALKSDWVGDRRGGTATTLGGGGRPLVGIHGTLNQKYVASFGVYSLAPKPVAQASREKSVRVPTVPIAPPENTEGMGEAIQEAVGRAIEENPIALLLAVIGVIIGTDLVVLLGLAIHRRMKDNKQHHQIPIG